MNTVFESELANENKKLGTLSVVYDDYDNRLSAVVLDKNNKVVHAQAPCSSGNVCYPFGEGAHIKLKADMINRDVVRFYMEEIAHADHPWSEDYTAKRWQEITRAGFGKMLSTGIQGLRVGVYPPYRPERLYEMYLRYYGMCVTVREVETNPDVITKDFVEFYLKDVGLDPADHNVTELMYKWRYEVAAGNTVVLAEDVFHHMNNGDVEKVEENDRYTVTRNIFSDGTGTFVGGDWPTLGVCYRKYVDHKYPEPEAAAEV